MRRKVISGQEAAALITDEDVLTTSGFVGIGVPDALLAAVEKRYLETGHPKNLSLVFAAGQGDGGERGLNRLGHKGLLRRVIGGHPRRPAGPMAPGAVSGFRDRHADWSLCDQRSD